MSGATPGTRALDEFEAKQLLASYGVPVVGEARVHDAEAALVAAQRIGYPVVLKGCGAEFAHKTEMGLVHLNLTQPDQVCNAAQALLRAMDGRGELLVQRMVSGKREFLVGMKRDAQFGPVVTFGLGGIFTEALADVALRVCPISTEDAVRMQSEIRAHKLLGPLRGLPAVDKAAIARAIVGVARLAMERPDVEEIDINPLLVTGAEPVAVDALVILRTT